MTAPTYSKGGVQAATATKLSPAVFGVMPQNHELLKLAYIVYLANGRENLAITKTRGLVSGGGKKPWRQKGTGRARFGSSRNPIWRGGGIAFGPTGEENFSKRITTSSKRLALRQALSLAASEGRIRIIEAFENKDSKVTATVKLMEKVDAKGRVLLVLDHKDSGTERAVGNLQNMKVVNAAYLSVYDVMNADTLVISEKAVEMVVNRLGLSDGNKGARP